VTAPTLAEELDRLRACPGDHAPPGELDSLEREYAGGADEALRRVRGVLEVVLSRSAGDWPGLEEWRRLLPAWFVDCCVDDVQLRDCVVDKWSLRAWVHWFQPGIRKWRWWDATASGDHLEVRILVLERPYLRGALEWLLQVAG
jgi:hypothetical protein